MKLVTIHSDGACEGNPGPGGWAAVLQYGAQRKEVSGGVPATTNNRMELMGAIEALRALKEHCRVEFFTDSAYVQAGITKGVRTWKRTNWRTSAKTPVKNKDLWIALDELTARHEVTWKWLKGHAGHVENERCDLLARAAIGLIRQSYSSSQLATLLAEFKLAQAQAESGGNRLAQSTIFA